MASARWKISREVEKAIRAITAEENPENHEPEDFAATPSVFNISNNTYLVETSFFNSLFSCLL